jgi:voltage-gated potassium channel Kch
MVAMSAWEAFEAIVLPRTVSRKIRFTVLFYFFLWRASRLAARLLTKRPAIRESFLSVVAPLGLLLLIVCWTLGIILGFALIHYGLGTPLSNGETGFGTDLYMSAATFFTLGYGDVVAREGAGRFVSMVEAGMGFGGLALVIGYMPVLYQSFSARERVSLLLDARAGSPPVAAALLAFYGDDARGLEGIFHEFERWAGSLLESYLSFPILSSYRSQHELLSWLASATCVCDASAFVMTCYKGDSVELRSLHRQASLTYAMLRHLAVDLSYILDVGPVVPPEPRLDASTWKGIVGGLAETGAPVLVENGACERLTSLRAAYEPYVYGLSRGLSLSLPGWAAATAGPASWETTAWDEGKHF